MLNQHLGFTGNEEYQPPSSFLLPPSVPGEPQDMMGGMPGAYGEPQDMMTGVPGDLGGLPGQPQYSDPRLPPAFFEAVAADKKIQAIKIYREATGVGLKEAKDYVDSIDPHRRKRR